MLTYKKTITEEKPRLKILYDTDADNPREWGDNLGYFFTSERNNISPDGKDHPLYSIMNETGDRAENTEDHMKKIKSEAKKQGFNIVYICPVVKYEHSSIKYSRGIMHGFDYSNCGFYIVTKESQEILGTEKKYFEKVIDQELDMYTQWANGEVFGFMLYDKEGEIEDSCWGFYDIEEIRERLPKEFEKENLNDYINI